MVQTTTVTQPSVVKEEVVHRGPAKYTSKYESIAGPSKVVEVRQEPAMMVR
jgi:hypothetical protein